MELAYRLPRVWARVLAGEVAVWKARRIAQATASLPPEGAAAVDRALYFVSVSRFLCKESALFLVLLGFRGGG